MGTVTTLRAPPTQERLSGKARCCACRHDWIAAAPVGVDWLECPECGLMKGRFYYHALPPADGDMWVCACGCDVFHVTRAAAFCINCGTEQLFP